MSIGAQRPDRVRFGAKILFFVFCHSTHYAFQGVRKESFLRLVVIKNVWWKTTAFLRFALNPRCDRLKKKQFSGP